jgi:hypothetical protein
LVAGPAELTGGAPHALNVEPSGAFDYSHSAHYGAGAYAQPCGQYQLIGATFLILQVQVNNNIDAE